MKIEAFYEIDIVYKILLISEFSISYISNVSFSKVFLCILRRMYVKIGLYNYHILQKLNFVFHANYLGVTYFMVKIRSNCSTYIPGQTNRHFFIQIYFLWRLTSLVP